MSTKNKQKQPKPEPIDDSETTENEFSELETKKEPKLKGNQPDVRQKIKESLEREEEDSAPFPRPSMTRNIPIDIKYKNLKVRTFWTIIMLVSFIGIVAAGHFYCAMLVLLLNTGMVKEILSLKRNKERDNEVQFSLALNWYFYAVAVFYFYGKAFSANLVRFTYTSKAVSFLMDYHEITSFILWIAGFLMFTLSLKKGYLRYQFRQFGWTHLCLMLIMGQGVAMVSNIYQGIIWFLLPCLLVISNDTFAYLFGIVFGKTQLIALSPKKTLEGFIGGMLSTLAFAFIFSKTLSKFEYMICPQHELTLKPFEFITCQPPITFQFFDYKLPDIPFLGIVDWSIEMSEFQVHSLILACFTSLVSPFGGFFASGFKRAIKIKDFADVIPGHGGITDRMDCQVLTGAFVYMYIRQIVNGRINYVNGVTRFIMGEMDSTNQLLIFKALQNLLIKNGALNATAI